MSVNIAVVGATGNVGSQILKILHERNFPVGKIYALASSKSIGKEMSFGDKIIKTELLDDFDFAKVDLVLSSPGAKVSAEFAPRAVKAGAVVIDNTSFFRDDNDIPLVVPEVNSSDIANYKNKNIIANPNCAAIQLAVALNPIHELFGVKKVVVSTYQSVSGAGKKAMDELYHQTKGMYSYQKVKPENFAKQIAFNPLPQIDKFMTDGYTGEEDKIRKEIKKIVDASIEVVPTCVRVPAFIGHAESVYVECEDSVDLEKLIKEYSKRDGIVFSNNDYATQVEVAGKDEVYISRLRAVEGDSKALLFWVVADNLRKGAALNAVQIAEELVKNYF